MSNEVEPGQPAGGGLDSFFRGWDLRKLTIWDSVAGIAAVLVFIGSFLPWATFAGILSVSGTSGDGVITLILAIASLVLLAVAVRTGVEPRHERWLRT